jgi:hypothetical protein
VGDAHPTWLPGRAVGKPEMRQILGNLGRGAIVLENAIGAMERSTKTKTSFLFQFPLLFSVEHN